MKDSSKLNLVREFNSPVPKREIGLVYGKTFIKKQLVSALKKEILYSVPKELTDKKEGLIIH
jgi:LysR family hydrogen peroxide-inducible transcriptional activator